MPAMTPAELLLTVREILRNALMTMAAARDPDKRYQGWRSSGLEPVHSIQEAYGYASASVRAFTPSAAEISQAERVAPWLAWLRRDLGDDALRRITAWALGVPAWRLAQREDCSERQVMRRIDRSVAAVIAHFLGDTITVEYLDEPAKTQPTFALSFAPDRTTDATSTVPMKIYVGGRGMWRNGRWLRGGQHA